MKILIIDDEPLVRRALSAAAERRGHTVHQAVNGHEGQRLWQELKPDVVYLDVIMPGLTGPQLLQRMLPHNSSKVVLISAYTGEYDAKKAQDLGADLFVGKPFEDILKVIQQAEGLIENASS